MYATISSACHNGALSLNADDVSGIRFLYPNGGAPTAPPGPPSGLAATVTGSSVTLRWAAPAGATATAYQIEAGSAPGMTNLANFSTGSAATQYSASGVPAGTYYARVRSMNLGGISAATSNEIVIVVR